MKKLLFILSLIFVFIMLGGDLLAQCPMCRIAAESNLENGGTAGKGLNTGILYMLTLPYFIVGIIAYLWYKNRKTPVDYLEEELQTSVQ